MPTTFRRRFEAVLWILGATTLAIVFYLGAELAERHTLFAIRRIEVKGNVRTPPESILAASNLAEGQSLFAENIERVSARLERLPWVRNAEVFRSIPDSVVIEVKEWEPKFLIFLDRLYYLSAEGHVVDAPLEEGLDFPVVTGLTRARLDAPGEERDHLLELFGLAAQGAFQGRLEEIHYDPDIGFTLYGSEPKPSAYFFGLGQLPDKFTRLAKLRKSLTERKQYAESADLSYADRVVAKLLPIEEKEDKK